jgi:hypothetical protein
MPKLRDSQGAYEAPDRQPLCCRLRRKLIWLFLDPSEGRGLQRSSSGVDSEQQAPQKSPALVELTRLHNSTVAGVVQIWRTSTTKIHPM